MQTYMQNQTVQREQMVIGGNPYCCNPYWHKSELRPTIWLHTRNLDVLAEGRIPFFLCTKSTTEMTRNDFFFLPVTVGLPYALFMVLFHLEIVEIVTQRRQQ